MGSYFPCRSPKLLCTAGSRLPYTTGTHAYLPSPSACTWPTPGNGRCGTATNVPSRASLANACVRTALAIAGSTS